jgi:hypothetical protein
MEEAIVSFKNLEMYKNDFKCNLHFTISLVMQWSGSEYAI